MSSIMTRRKARNSPCCSGASCCFGTATKTTSSPNQRPSSYSHIPTYNNNIQCNDIRPPLSSPPLMIHHTHTEFSNENFVWWQNNRKQPTTASIKKIYHHHHENVDKSFEEAWPTEMMMMTTTTLPSAKTKRFFGGVGRSVPFMMMPLLFLLILAAIISPFSVAVVAADDLTNTEEKVSFVEPEFISKGGNILAKEGSTVRLECEIKDLGEHAFMWKSKNRFLYVGNLAIQPVTGIEKDPNSNAIIIENMTRNHVGEYSCEISSTPIKAILYNVTMAVPPEIIPKPSEKEIVIPREQTLNLQCNVKPSPMPTTFKWIHNSKVIQNNQSQFVIPSISLDDSGEVTCQASNEVGERSFTFTINVEAPPMLTVSDKVVHGSIGDDIEIKCSAKAYPPAKIEWFFGNNSRIHISKKHKIVDLGDSSTLTIHRVDPKDHDNYYCQATNKLGTETAYFEVTGRPSKPHFTSPYVSNDGETYTLEWTVFSQTPIISYVLKFREVDQETRQPGEWRTIQVEPTETNEGPLRKQTQILENLSKDKTYEVQVEVENEFGKTESDMFVFSTTDYNGTSNISMSSYCSTLLFLLISLMIVVEINSVQSLLL